MLIRTTTEWHWLHRSDASVCSVGVWNWGQVKTDSANRWSDGCESTADAESAKQAGSVECDFASEFT